MHTFPSLGHLPSKIGDSMSKIKPKVRKSNKKCPRCKTNDKAKWTKSGYNNSTYCQECQRYYNEKKRGKMHEKINKATNNGKCWWVYQSIIAELNSRGM
tara:strand:+ start:710 stop:1006 length:297 start_codon:yes stop_codon:yes gene_type:complete